ncbi:MAG: chemotaxis protein CheW [Arenicella sp.]|nr:chemotaxis protein CheW [Arenicella sp.]
METASLTQMLSQELEVESTFAEAVRVDDVRYVIEINNLNLVLPQGILSELVEAPQYAELPLMPENVVGLCNFRGNLVPVFNLYTHLKMGKEIKGRYLIALGEGGNTVGVLLESLPYMVRESECIPTAQVPTLPNTLNPYISNVFKRDNQVLVEYDHDAFFASLCE